MLPFWALTSRDIPDIRDRNNNITTKRSTSNIAYERIIEMSINQIFRRTGSSVRRISTLLEAEMDKYKKMLSKSSPVEIEDFKTKFEP